jgi:hypothetical protein
MRYLIGSQMGLYAVPIIFVVGAAYVWVMERLLGKKAQADKPAEITSESKAA